MEKNVVLVGLNCCIAFVFKLWFFQNFVSRVNIGGP